LPDIFALIFMLLFVIILTKCNLLGVGSMVRLLNLSEMKQSLINKSQTAVGWLGRHKVELAGVVATTALVAAVTAVSVMTFGATAIVAGSVLGGAALITGVGTGAYGIYKNNSAKEKTKSEIAKNTRLQRVSKIYYSLLGAEVITLLATVVSIAKGWIDPNNGMGAHYAFASALAFAGGAMLTAGEYGFLTL
jgi:hypothetical protein